MNASLFKRIILILLMYSAHAYTAPLTFFAESDLPYTINTPGTYVLSSDATFSPLVTTSSAIIINSDSVTLDLNGRTLTSGNANAVTGVELTTSVTNVTIKNGTLKQFINQGITATNGGSALYISNIHVIGDRGGVNAGFQFTDFIDIFMTHCSSIHNRDGIALTRCSNVTIEQSNFSNCTGVNASGLLAVGICNNVTITESHFDNNTHTGFAAGLRMLDLSSCWHINKCSFDGNSSSSTSSNLYGALMICEGALIENCSFCANSNTSGGSSTGLVTGLELRGNSQGSIIKNCIFNRNNTDSTATTTVYGLSVISPDCFIEDCAAIGNATTAAGTANLVPFAIQRSNNLLNRCVAGSNNVVGDGSLRCFDTTFGSSSIFQECEANGNHSDGSSSFCIGFYLSTSSHRLHKCNAYRNSGGSSPAHSGIGFFTDDSNSTLSECNASNGGGNLATGFYGTVSGLVFRQCTAETNAIGFFDSTSAGSNKYYGCKASNSSSYNYSDVVITLTITTAGGANVSGDTTSYTDGGGSVYGSNSIANYSFS